MTASEHTPASPAKTSENQAGTPPPTVSGLAVACLAFGVCGAMSSFLVIGLIPSAIGLLLGLVCLLRGARQTHLAAAGAGLSGCGLIIGCVVLVLTLFLVSGFRSAMKSADMLAEPEADTDSIPDHVTGVPARNSLLRLWSFPLQGVEGADAGDWNGDGAPDLVLATGSGMLCLDVAGREMGRCRTSGGTPRTLRCGKSRKGARFAVLTDNDVRVHDSEGGMLWKYKHFMGINDVQWVGMDGSGDDSLMVGTNGFGGVHLVSPEGKRVWRNDAGGNNWTVAALRTAKGESLLYTSCSAGTVVALNPEGDITDNLRPADGYFTEIAVMEAAPGGEVQIAGVAKCRDGVSRGSGTLFLVAFDRAGQPLWKCPLATSFRSIKTVGLASGDLDGDGVREWVVADREEVLVLDTEGQLVCRAEMAGENPVVLPQPNGRGLLAVVNDGVVEGYELAPPVPAQP